MRGEEIHHGLSEKMSSERFPFSGVQALNSILTLRQPSPQTLRPYCPQIRSELDSDGKSKAAQ
jgi:hypothetical protein